MRDLYKHELAYVTGGLAVSPIDLDPITVHPDPGSGGGSIGGGGSGAPRSDGGGSGGGSASNSGGLGASAITGLTRIKTELGVDLTAYAQMSPTLSNAIASAVASFDWHFDFSAQGSSTAYSTSGIGGVIHIDSAVQGRTDAIVQQLSHELSHTEHRVWDVAKNETSTQYVNAYLKAEGYSTLENESVRHEILNATGGGLDIGVATANPNVTLSLYEAQYQRAIANPFERDAAAVQIGQIYGQYETVKDGETYQQVFLDNYHRDGGTK